MEGISDQRSGLRQQLDGGVDKTLILNPDWVEWLMGYPVGLSSIEQMKEKSIEEWRESVRSMSWWNDERWLPRLVKKVRGDKEENSLRPSVMDRFLSLLMLLGSY